MSANPKRSSDYGWFSVPKKSVKDFKELIQAIATQEYYRLQDRRIPFRQVVRLAALTVHMTLLSGQRISANALATIMRQTLRQELAPYY